MAITIYTAAFIVYMANLHYREEGKGRPYRVYYAT